MQDKNIRGQAAIRSGWYRLGGWIWFRITMLALVVILLVAYSVEVFRCSYYEPTGDALYDRYATAVISRQRWVLFHGTRHHPTYLPDSLLAEWEGEFGSDPRYWQLRYFCARHKGGYGMYSAKKSIALGWDGMRNWDDYPTEEESNAWRHLQTGVEKGAADWVTFEMLHREPGMDFYAEQDQELEDVKALGLETAERYLAIGAVYRKYEQQELDRLDLMVAAGTSQAWPYYWRAKYWFKYGEGELALADFKSGNAAPNNEMSRTFPVGFLQKRMAYGGHLGNDILAGAIFEEGSAHGLRNWIVWKDAVKQALLMVAFGGDSEILQELHLFSCRLGMAENNDDWEPVVAAVFEMMFSQDLLVEYGEDLTPRQRRTIMKMYERANAAQTSWKMRSAEMWPYVKNFPRLGLLEPKTTFNLPGVTGVPVNPPDRRKISFETFCQYVQPRLYYNRALWLQEQQHAGVVGIRSSFEQLEFLDMNTLEWPQEWGNPY